MATRAALGFKLHTGWAMLVALAGEPGEIQVLFRGRIELLPPGESVPRFVYHKAAELPLSRATALVKRVREASQKAARSAIKDVLRDLDSREVKVAVCGVLSGSTPVPDDLSRILRSHPLIHAAEGALFQQAIVSAGESCDLAVTAAREREVWSRAAAAWGITEPGLRKNVDALRKSLGPPWSADHKSAAAMALLVLKTSP
ncbi:MAG: hypothetical protein ACHP7J_04775 [Terriglobales bacterium]